MRELILGFMRGRIQLLPDYLNSELFPTEEPLSGVGSRLTEDTHNEDTPMRILQLG